MKKETAKYSSLAYRSVFQCLGTTLSVSDDIVDQLEQFVCHMYGKSTYKDVNKVRWDIFKSRYGAKTHAKSFTISNGIDLSLLPPCMADLRLHIMSANYKSFIWRQSHIAYVDIPSPIGNGWMTDEGGNLIV